MKHKFRLSVLICSLFSLTCVQKGFSQLKGHKLLGLVGLDAGTQAPSGSLLLGVPMLFYDASSLKNANGDKINAKPNLNMFLTGIGAGYVSNFKILGANYGAGIFVPFASNRMQGNNVDSKSSFALTDVFFQPLQLGWKTKAADFMFKYGFFLPTGKYENGGDNNSGLGIVTNEVGAGTTIRLDPRGTINFSTLLSYEIHSHKKGTDIKPGDLFSIEGGLGKTWYLLNADKKPTSIIKAGLVYYMQFKATKDQLPASSLPFFPSGKDRVYGLGLEGNILLTKSKTLLILRWFDEFGGVNRFQGNTFFVSIARDILKPTPKKKTE